MICPKCGLVIPLNREPSKFDGGMLSYWAHQLGAACVTILTLGIAYPWMLCWVQSWYAQHTIINGRRLRFDGTGLQMLGTWIKWWFLSIITVGIYALWLPVKVEGWVVKHMSVSDDVVVVLDSTSGEYSQPIPAPAEREMVPEIADSAPRGRETVAIILTVLACLCLAFEIAAVIANLWFATSAFAALLPAWTVLAAMGGMLVCAVSAYFSVEGS